MIKKYANLFDMQLTAHVVWYIIGFLLILLIGILPDSKKILELDSKINDIRDIIEKKNALIPAYHQLIAIKKQPMALPMPEKKPITGENIESVINTLKESALPCCLKDESMILDITTIKKDSHSYVLVIKMTGEFTVCAPSY
ncbi:MAG: hypothetical protein HQL01_09930 [Nitrospirae bacterium]|nr:hypothetical protein [Nitrospirota bacterium]